MKTSMRKALSLMLAFVMVFSATGLVSIAGNLTADGTEAAIKEQTAEQIVEAGGEYIYYDKDGIEVTKNDDYAVAVKKTLEGTGTENVFNVNLEVVTTQKVEELAISEDAAVMFVLDSSGSMGDDGKMASAKAATENFIKDFVTNAGDSERLVSFVQFGSNAATVAKWENANAGNNTVATSVLDSMDRIQVGTLIGECSHDGDTHNYDMAEYKGTLGLDGDWEYRDWARYCKVCDIPYDNGNNANHMHCETHGEFISNTSVGEGTNIEGGMMLANNVIEEAQVVGGMLDGIDSLYVIVLTDGVPTFHVDDNNTSTTFIQGSRGGGNYATRDDYKDVPGVATSLKDNGAKLFAVSYATGSSTVNGKTVDNWLKNDVKVDGSYKASNADELNLTFGNISAIIEVSSKAWIVHDYLAAPAEYVGSANSNVTYAPATGVQWDIKNETPTQSGDQFTYSTSYQVLLNNTGANFMAQNAYDLHGTAALHFMLLDETVDLASLTESEIEALLKEAAFGRVKAQGFIGDIEFDKVREDEVTALPGATFTATGTANGKTVTKTATSDDNGLVKFTGLPSGFTYTITETVAPAGYELSETTRSATISYGDLQNANDVQADFVNMPTQRTIDLTVTKTWNAPVGTFEGKTVTINLFQDGTAYDVVTLTAANALEGTSHIWQATVTVPDNNVANGGNHVYTITEDAIVGFDATYGTADLSVANTITDVIESISVEKVWMLPEGMAAPSVEVELLANGVATGNKLTLTANNLTDAFENVEMYDASGAAITYTVTENIPEGATYNLVGIEGDAETGFVVTNTVNNEKFPISGLKTWTLPEGVTENPIATIALYIDGVPTTHITDTDVDGNFSFTTTDEEGATVPVMFDRYEFMEDGTVREIEYFVREMDGNTAVAEGGKITIGGYEYTVTYGSMYGVHNAVTATVDVTVEKVWVDLADASHDGVEVTLMQGTVAFGDAVELNDANGWTYTWTVPANDDNGDAYNYTVVESAVDGYSSAVTVDTASGAYIVTNTLNQDETVSVDGTKYWAKPSTVETPDTLIGLYTVTFVNDVEELTFTGKTTAPDKATGSYSFTGLDKYTYETVVVEEAVEEVTDETGTVITPAKEEVTEQQAVEIIYTVAEGYFDEDNTFVAVLHGETIELDGNTYEVSQDGTWIMNTITGKTSLPVNKVWVDAANNDGRPEFVTIKLMIGTGENAVATTVPDMILSDENTWASSFTGLDMYDGEGQRIVYSVVEEAVAGYTTSYGTNENGGIIVTNTLNNGTTNVAVTKTWIDGGSDNRPSITINLLQNGIEIAEYVMPNTETAYTFEALPLYSADLTTAYVYTVTEDAVDGYNTSVNGYAITNSLPVSNDVDVTVEKRWVAPVDMVEDYGITATFNLMADGVQVDEVTLPIEVNGVDTWTYTFEDLANRNASGATINYTVEEEDVAGFTEADPVVTGNTFVFTNTIEQHNDTFISGEKLWVDNSSDFHTPEVVESILVQLYQDGVAVGTPTEVMYDDQMQGWYFDFSGLDMYNLTTGQEYKYTVKEVYLNANGDVVPVEEDGTITYGSDDYKVNYDLMVPMALEVATPDEVYVPNVNYYMTITNTYIEPSRFHYTVEATYEVYESGNLVSTITKNIEVKNGLANIINVDPATYATYDDAGTPSIAHKYVSGTVDGLATELTDGTLTATLEANTSHKITMLYRADYYNVTTNYTFADGSTHAGYDSTTVKYLDGTAYTTDAKAAPADYNINVPANANGTVNGQDITVVYNYTTGGNDRPDREDDPDPDPTPDPTPEPTPDPDDDVIIPDTIPPLAEIPEVDVPLAEIPEVEVPLAELPEVEVPLAVAPDTGDDSMIVPFAISMALSAAGLVALNVKRKDEAEEA